MKVQRNDPCPCGSGKKYKKCCLGADEASTPTFVAAPDEFDQGHEPGCDFCDDDGHGHSHPQNQQFYVPDARELGRSGLNFHPYVIAKMVQDSDERFKPGARKIITPREVAALSTDEILARLSKIGIVIDRNGLAALAKGRTSAWTISDEWDRALGREIDPYDDDFMGLAACELWKRWVPEPSFEMLDDWMQEGYELLAAKKWEKACDVWEKTWGVIRSRLTPEMKTCESAKKVFEGTQCLFNWTQDFTLELLNTSRKNPAYGERGIKYVRELLAQFTEEDGNYLTNTQADLGDLLFALGRNDEATRVYLDLIRDHPKLSIGYCRLADEIMEADPAQALRLLEEARAKAQDGKDWDLDLRIKDLRKPKPNGSAANRS